MRIGGRSAASQAAGGPASQDDYLRDLQAQAEAKKREKLEAQLRERAETLQHLAGNKIGVQANGEGGDDVAGLHRLLRDQGARLNGEARLMGVAVDSAGGVAAVHPNVRRPLIGPPAGLMQPQLPAGAMGIFGRPGAAGMVGSPTPLIPPPVSVPGGMSQRDAVWERKRQQRTQQPAGAAAYGGYGAAVASNGGAANRRDEMYEVKRLEFQERQRLQQGGASLGAFGGGNGHGPLCTTREEPWDGYAGRQPSPGPREQLLNMAPPPQAPAMYQQHPTQQHSTQQQSIQQYSMPLAARPAPQYNQPVTRASALADGAEAGRRRQQQEYAQALQVQQENKQQTEIAVAAREAQSESINGAASSPHDVRRRQQQEYARALQVQQEQKQQMERAVALREAAQSESINGGVSSPHDVRRRQQKEYARALGAQQAEKEEDRLRERMRAREPPDDGFGSNEGADARRRAQREYRESLERQQRDKAAQGAADRARGGGGGLGLGDDRGVDARRRQQQEYAAALGEQQEMKRREAERERARDAGGGLGIGARTPPEDARRRQQAEYAAALEAQIAGGHGGERGGGRAGGRRTGGAESDGSGLFAGLGEGDEAARRRRAEQANYATELQAQAEIVRRRKGSEKADIEAAAQKAEAAEFDVFGRPIEGRIDPGEAKRRAMLEEQQRGIAAQRAEKAAEKAAAKEAERREEAREAARIERDRAQLREQFETEQQQRRSKEEAKAAGSEGGGAQEVGFLSKEERQKMQAAAYHRKMDERERLERRGGGAREAQAPPAQRDSGVDAAREGGNVGGPAAAASAEATDAGAARAQEQARLQRESSAAEAERGALRQQNEALHAAVREQAESQQRLMHEQLERMARIEASQQQQQQAHLDALKQQAAALQAAVAPLHAQGAVAVAAIARAHPHALRGLCIPQHASEGEQVAHHKEGNRLEDAVMRTPYLEEVVSIPGGNRASKQPPPTAPDDALIRLMVPQATASVPPPFRHAGTPGFTPNDSHRVMAAPRAEQRMLPSPDTAMAAGRPMPPEVGDGGRAEASRPQPPRQGRHTDEPRRASDEPRRAADEPRRSADGAYGSVGGSLGGNPLRGSLRGDSEWIFPPQEALNASLAPESRLPSAAPMPHAPPACDLEPSRPQSRGGLQPVAEEARSGGSLSSSTASPAFHLPTAGCTSAPASRLDSGRRRLAHGRPVSAPIGAAIGAWPGGAVEGGALAGAAVVGGAACACSRVVSRENSRRAFTPGLDSLVRRAEDRLRQLQLSERTPEATEAWQGEASPPTAPAGAPNGTRAGGGILPSAEMLRESMAADSAMCLPSDALPPLSAGAAPASGTTSTQGAADRAYSRLQRLAGPEWGELMSGDLHGQEGRRPVSGSRRADAVTADRRTLASPAPSDTSSVGGNSTGGYTRAVGARTEAQLRRIAELERHLGGGGSAPPAAGLTAGTAPVSRRGVESRGGEEAVGGTLGGLGSTSAMEERMRRLEALERELCPPSRGGGKEELDQLLTQWSGQGVAGA